MGTLSLSVQSHSQSLCVSCSSPPSFSMSEQSNSTDSSSSTLTDDTSELRRTITVDEFEIVNSAINTRLGKIETDIIAIRDDVRAMRSEINGMFAMMWEIIGKMEMIASQSERDIDAPPPCKKHRGRNVAQHK